MNLNIATPALLFPAISLLLLAYTNRFLAIASLVRTLYQQYTHSRDEKVIGQIQQLRRRLILIRNMQILGSLAFLACVLCMLLIYVKWFYIAGYVFGSGMVLLIVSLGISIWEVQISVQAIDIQLRDIYAEMQKG